MAEGDQIYGDGVNVAARLEGLAEPGGICISDVVHGQGRSKLSLHYHDLGRQRVKNIAQPVRVFRVLTEGTAHITKLTKRTGALWHPMLVPALGLSLLAAIVFGVVIRKWRADLAITQAPSAGVTAIRSIAVLPLDNFSDDPSQDYSAGGMTDELTTDLATI